MPPSISPGDFVIVGPETFLVWATTSTAIVALTLRVEGGLSQTRRVELGRVPFATIMGPSVVDIFERTNLHPANCIRIGHLTPTQQSALRFAIKRTSENQRAEQSVTASAIFSACQPVFRSGGRRVGVRAGV